MYTPSLTISPCRPLKKTKTQQGPSGLNNMWSNFFASGNKSTPRPTRGTTTVAATHASPTKVPHRGAARAKNNKGKGRADAASVSASSRSALPGEDQENVDPQPGIQDYGGISDADEAGGDERTGMRKGPLAVTMLPWVRSGRTVVGAPDELIIVPRKVSPTPQ